MSKFEMSPPDKPRKPITVPSVPLDAPGGSVSEKTITPPAAKGKGGSSSAVLSQKNMTSAFEIAKIIVQGQAEIAKIRANADAEIAKVEAEIKKIIASTQSDIAKMHAESSIWHSKFDARQQAVQRTHEFLEAHPEYSDEAKQLIIQLAIAVITER